MEHVLTQDETVLSERDRDIVLAMLAEDAPPNAALLRAAEDYVYRTRLGKDEREERSIMAEAGLLGSMLLDSACIAVLPPGLTADVFVRQAHQQIFKAMMAMWVAGKPIDLVLLRDELVEREQLEDAGGVEYFVALTEGIPRARPEFYAQKIVDAN